MIREDRRIADGPGIRIEFVPKKQRRNASMSDRYDVSTRRFCRIPLVGERPPKGSLLREHPIPDLHRFRLLEIFRRLSLHCLCLGPGDTQPRFTSHRGTGGRATATPPSPPSIPGEHRLTGRREQNDRQGPDQPPPQHQ